MAPAPQYVPYRDRTWTEAMLRNHIPDHVRENYEALVADQFGGNWHAFADEAERRSDNEDRMELASLAAWARQRAAQGPPPEDYGTDTDDTDTDDTDTDDTDTDGTDPDDTDAGTGTALSTVDPADDPFSERDSVGVGTPDDEMADGVAIDVPADDPTTAPPVKRGRPPRATAV